MAGAQRRKEFNPPSSQRRYKSRPGRYVPKKIRLSWHWMNLFDAERVVCKLLRQDLEGTRFIVRYDLFRESHEMNLADARAFAERMAIQYHEPSQICYGAVVSRIKILHRKPREATIEQSASSRDAKA